MALAGELAKRRVKRNAAIALLAAAWPCGNGIAADAPYPVHPIRLVVPYAPGGTGDAIGRPIAQRLSAVIGQTAFVENRGGAGGVAAAVNVAQSAPDGYTMLLASSGAFTISPNLTRLPYDPLGDFSPVALLAKAHFALCVHPSVPAISVKQLIMVARSRRGRLSFGSAGTGGVSHLAGELFKSMAGVEMTHVPYRGAGPMMVELVAGQIDLAFPAIASVLPFIRSQKLRALAVSGAQRSLPLPDLPTVEEAGLADYEASAFWGMVVPAKTPREIVGRLSSALGAILKTNELRSLWIAQGNDPMFGTPDELADLMRKETAKWRKTISSAGIASH